MSGTSLDGIDAALVEFKEDKIKLLAFEYLPFSDSITEGPVTILISANSAIGIWYPRGEGTSTRFNS